jgi:hypothetical protein
LRLLGFIECMRATGGGHGEVPLCWGTEVSG